MQLTWLTEKAGRWPWSEAEPVQVPGVHPCWRREDLFLTSTHCFFHLIAIICSSPIASRTVSWKGKRDSVWAPQTQHPEMKRSRWSLELYTRWHPQSTIDNSTAPTHWTPTLTQTLCSVKLRDKHHPGLVLFLEVSAPNKCHMSPELHILDLLTSNAQITVRRRRSNSKKGSSACFEV